MNPPEFFIIILGMGMVGGFVFDTSRRWFAMREKRLDIEAMRVAEKTAQYVASSRETEERIAVLEKIVTDGGYDTAAQIEALRKPRLSTPESYS